MNIITIGIIIILIIIHDNIIIIILIILNATNMFSSFARSLHLSSL